MDKKRPPSVARWILKRLMIYDCKYAITDDIEEEFYIIQADQGYAVSWIWYMIQTSLSVYEYIKLTIFWSLSMFQNYFKIAYRNIKRQKGYSIINISGLAVGFAIACVLAFYVIDDLSYDNFHEDGENIYRVLSVSERGTRNGITAGPLIAKSGTDIPEIIASARITTYGVAAIRSSKEDTEIRGRILVADPGFFDIFSFKIISGSSSDALLEESSLFITEKFAKTLFANEDPIGKAIILGRNDEFTIVGIVDTPPTNSHIRYDVIIPLIPAQNTHSWDSWRNLGVVGYVRLENVTDAAEVEQKMIEIGKENNLYELFEPRLQPMLDIHLGSAGYLYDRINMGKNDRVVVIALGTIGIIILIIACINFINLSTARAAKRAREVGVRKVIGSKRKQLSAQFLGESLFFTSIAFVIALVMIYLASPYLNTGLDKELNLNVFSSINDLTVLFGVSLLVGILSGIYPAMVLSSFNPVTVLKGDHKAGSQGVLMRKILIVFQFVMTISLSAGVMIVYNQIDYLKKIPYGYNRENVIAVPSGLINGEDILKQRLSEYPEISSLGRMDAIPAMNFTRYQIIPEGTERAKSYTASVLNIDDNLLNTLEISLYAGRGFSKEFTTDKQNAVIINKFLSDKAGWDKPIGKILEVESDGGVVVPYTVIGVAYDLNFNPARKKTEPMVFMFRPERGRLLFARILTKQTEQVLDKIGEVYSELYPERNYRFYFLDDLFNEQFDEDRNFAGNIGTFSIIAVLIACLGLIGLASHTIEIRRREIVIRKILGCRIRKIIYLLTSDFLKWVLLANIIAWPIAYFAMSQWQNNFVYKAPFTISPYILAAFGSVTIATLTILYQTIKVARTNMVDSLHCD